MKRLAHSELILNQDNSIFHLHLKPAEIADTILLVGDPGRVPVVSAHFDRIEVTRQNREFITHTGFYKNERLTVLSTGIGTDNIDIVVNELDALANIDLEKRQVKTDLRQLHLLRLGTCGGLQPELKPGSGALSNFAVGFDNLMQFYEYEENGRAKELQQALHKHLLQNHLDLSFYAVEAEGNLVKKLSRAFVGGITATCPGFYAPQGRSLRLAPRYGSFLDVLSEFHFGDNKILNFEMETSAIFSLAHLMGHDSSTVAMILANRVTSEVLHDPEAEMERFIPSVLDAVIG